MRLGQPRLFSPLISLSLFICRIGFSQLSGSFVQPEPVLGAGHSYIGSGGETVSLSGGSLKFNLPIETVPGRQLSFLLAFGITHPRPINIMWTPPPPSRSRTISPFNFNGWYLNLPKYQALAYVSSATPVSSGCGNPARNPCPGGNTNYCWSSRGYVYQGLYETPYDLSIVNSWPVIPKTTYAFRLHIRTMASAQIVPR